MPTGFVTAQFTFASSPLPANTPFQFVISGITNPSTTLPIQVVTMALRDHQGSVIPESVAAIPTFSMKIPATIVASSLTLDDYQLY